MNLNPLITIIVPVYNVEKYLEKCIKSVINQSYKNLQIILVDDGSTDKSGDICDYYARIDKRIQVIHKKNEGLSEARNVALNLVKGKYIGFVDSDDYIKITMYEDLLNSIIEYDADISICNFYNVINGKSIVKNDITKNKIYNKVEILKEIILDKDIQSYAWNKLYKSELFNEIRYPIGRKYEDIGTTFYLLEKCNKVVVLGKPEYYYLNREDSLVNTVTEETIIDYLEIIMERSNYIEQNFPELIKYNNLYLMKILITSYRDSQQISNKSLKFNDVIRSFYKKIEKIGINNIKYVEDLCDEKELNEIKKIFKK